VGRRRKKEGIGVEKPSQFQASSYQFLISRSSIEQPVTREKDIPLIACWKRGGKRYCVDHIRPHLIEKVGFSHFPMLPLNRAPVEGE
jgi:hypothetical protein